MNRNVTHTNTRSTNSDLPHEREDEDRGNGRLQSLMVSDSSYLMSQMRMRDEDADQVLTAWRVSENEGE